MNEINLEPQNHRYRGWRESEKLLATARAAAADFVRIQSLAAASNALYQTILPLVAPDSLAGNLADLLQQVAYRLDRSA